MTHFNRFWYLSPTWVVFQEHCKHRVPHFRGYPFWFERYGCCLNISPSVLWKHLFLCWGWWRLNRAQKISGVKRMRWIPSTTSPPVPSVAVLQDLMGICSLMSLYRALFKVLGSPRWSRHLCEHYKYLCVLKPWTLTSDQQPLSAVDAWQFSSFISHLMSVGTHFPVLHTHSSTATMAAAACTSDYKVYPPAENVRSAPRNKKTSSNSSSGSLCLSLSLC